MSSSEEKIASLEESLRACERELSVHKQLLALVLYSVAEPVDIREEYYDDALNGRVIQLDEYHNGLIIELVPDE